jgi:hypothetical protein
MDDGAHSMGLDDAPDEESDASNRNHHSLHCEQMAAELRAIRISKLILSMW